MQSLNDYADEIIKYLSSFEEVRSCTLYGSLANNKFDIYSDIDIEVDVSGYDNSLYVTRLSEIMSVKYPIIFSDYATSLIPESYIVSIAIDENNPFLIIDFNCIANPHYTTLSKQDFKNDKVYHTMKVWTANCKHYLRRIECYNDIVKMAKRVIGTEKTSYMSELEMLDATLTWLEHNCEEKQYKYISNCRQFIE